MQDRYLPQADNRILKYLLTTWWGDWAKRNVRDYNGFPQIGLAHHKVIESMNQNRLDKQFSFGNDKFTQIW